jgi:hypothetical protein
MNDLYSTLLALVNCFGVLVYCRVLTLVSKNMLLFLADDFPVTAWTHISLLKTCTQCADITNF